MEVYDPHADKIEVYNEYGINLITKLNKYDAIILAVSHFEFSELNYTNLKSTKQSILFDTKSILDISLIDSRL